MIDPKQLVLPSSPDRGYVYAPELAMAIRVALATDRPLLLRGAPGTGKTTMAKDLARLVGADFYQEVITSRTEARDLEWKFDTVLRLAEAQLDSKKQRVELAANYVEPRALWWAFDPDSARKRGHVERIEVAPADPIPDGSSVTRDAVVIIDEIDKAEPEVANDLLEPFDTKTFRVAETGAVVTKKRSVFLVVTTNDERDLPAAFLRRCIVHTLSRPDREMLHRIARSQRGKDYDPKVSDRLIDRVEALAADARGRNLREPGTAEVLDALNALAALDDEKTWESIARLALWKHPSPPTEKR